MRNFKRDWTKPDAEIESWLRHYGRAGVPFYLLDLHRQAHRVLPEILDEGSLLADSQAE